MNEVYTVDELAMTNDEDQTLVLIIEQLEAGNVLHSDKKVDSTARILDDMPEEFKLRLVNYVINSNDPSLSKQKAMIQRNIEGAAKSLFNDCAAGF
tara:strand:- start:1108 stop:1395 length:288 start_codon:yes stop_codon:yes gene_type:complete